MKPAFFAHYVDGQNTPTYAFICVDENPENPGMPDIPTPPETTLVHIPNLDKVSDLMSKGAVFLNLHKCLDIPYEKTGYERSN
jgi:hypothetical protein